jgi:hypothetical protein
VTITPGPADDFLDRLGVSENLRSLIRRTGAEFELNSKWMSFDDFAYEASEADASFDLNEVFRMPSSLGGVWTSEELSLTGLGLFEARTAPTTCTTMLDLVVICVERKKRLRDGATIGSGSLIDEYGWTDDAVERAHRMIRLIPGLIGGGNEQEGNWQFDIFRGALLEYRLVESTDDLWAVLQRQAQEKLALQEEGLRSALSLGISTDPGGAFEYDAMPGTVDFVDEQTPEERLWRTNHIRVFLSHIHEHCEFTQDVCEVLRELGVDGFVAHTMIEPSQVWQDEIEYALNSSDVLVGLLHPGFSKSIWTQQEIGWARGRGIPTLMVRLGEDPTGFSGHFQASAGSPSARITASRILVWLCTIAPFGPRLTQMLVASLRGATSYVDAKEAALRLDEIGHLTSPILDAIGEAYLLNDQIGGHVAESIVERVLKRHGRNLPPRVSR